MANQSLDTSLLSYDNLHDRGLTLRSLAARLGVRDSSVDAWRKGRNQPSAEYQARLASLLGVSVERLMSKPKDEWTMAKAHRAAGMMVCAPDDGLSEMSPVRRRIELRRRANASYYAACDMP